MSCSIKPLLTQARRQAVSVNGVGIAHDLISRETQNHPAANPTLAWTAATRALVVRELLLQEARRIGLCAEPLGDAEGRRETEAEALVRGLIESEVRTPTPDAESCRRYYDANAARFRSQDIFECAHILIAARRRDGEAFTAARQRADGLLAHLREHPRDFAKLASSQSDCASGAVGGNLGQVTPGATTPEFEAALRRLTPAEISPVVETRYGLHIIRLDRHLPGELLPFELVHGKIKSYLADRSQRIAAAQYVALLASRAQVIGIDLPTPASLRVH
jgi:peptidyl-prolyl cis-trans isomerase C